MYNYIVISMFLESSKKQHLNYERGENMAKPTKKAMSREEVLEQAATLVAGTINPDAMGMEPEEVPLEEFIRLFIQKAGEMLDQSQDGYLRFSIGPYLNKEENLYASDLYPIIEFIEEKLQRKLYFFNGILIFMGENDIAANWIPEWPV